MIVLLPLFLLLILIFALFLCYYFTFFRSNLRCAGDRDVPKGKQYAPFREKMLGNIDRLLDTPCQPVTIKSHDGLSLYGRYYHHADSAPVVIMFHGYRSSAIRDGSGGFWGFRDMGYNILLVDQRAHGNSQGHTITFGIKERLDCGSWVAYAAQRFGADVPIILVGVSMGAATVLMASELPLAGNVRGIIADCGYSSVKGILTEVMNQLRLPGKLGYPFLRLGAKVFGRFDPEEASPREALKHSRYPILLIHGEDDRFVPCTMSHENHEACSAVKDILTVPKAGHGMSFYADTRAYEAAVSKFIQRCM